MAPQLDLIRRFRAIFARFWRPDLVGGATVKLGLWTLIARVSGIGLLFLSNLMIARFAGAAEYGVYSYGAVVANILSVIASLGIGASGVRFLPQYQHAGAVGYQRGFVLFSIGGAVISGIVVAVFFIAFCLSVPTAVTVILPVLYPLAASIAIQSVNVTLIELMRSHMWSVHAIIFNSILMPIVLMSAVYVTAREGLIDAATASWLTVASLAIVLVAQLATFWHRVRTPEFVAASASYERRSWLSSGMPIVFALAISQITFYVDTSLVAVLLSPKELGTYRVASQVSYLLVFGPATIYTAIGGVLSREYLHLTRAEFGRMLNHVHGLIFVPVTLLALALAGGTDWLLQLFGRGFESGRDPILIIVGASLVRLSLGPSDLLLVLAGRERQRLCVEGVAFGVALAVGFLLVPRYGLVGAALTHAVTWLGSAVGLYILAYRATGVRVLWYGIWTPKALKPNSAPTNSD